MGAAAGEARVAEGDPHRLRRVARALRRPVVQLRCPAPPEGGEAQCAVCLEPMRGRPVYHLPCTHSFHVRCLVRWRDRAGNCPLCRAAVPAPRPPPAPDPLEQLARILHEALHGRPPPVRRQSGAGGGEAEGWDEAEGGDEGLSSMTVITVGDLTIDSVFAAFIAALSEPPESGGGQGG